MAVTVNATATGFDAGVPAPLFDVRSPEVVAAPFFHHYAASADGQRFLVNTMAQDSTALPITVVLNWAADRRR